MAGDELKGPDDMQVVDGIYVRPEDVEDVKKRQKALRDAEEAAVEPDEEVGMVVVDGVKYRPEDVPKGEKGEALTTKAAQPRNKARTAKNK